MANDDIAKEIPHNVFNFVNSSLVTWAKEAEVEFGVSNEKDKLLDKVKDLSAVELIELLETQPEIKDLILNSKLNACYTNLSKLTLITYASNVCKILELVDAKSPEYLYKNYDFFLKILVLSRMITSYPSSPSFPSIGFISRTSFSDSIFAPFTCAK